MHNEINYQPLTINYIKPNQCIYRIYDNELYICYIKHVDPVARTFTAINLCDKKYHKLFNLHNVPFDDGPKLFLVTQPAAPGYTNDDGWTKLAGKIIQKACYYYYREIPSLPSNFNKLSPEEKRIEEQKVIDAIREKKQAELFFDKSSLFKATNLSKDYVLSHYKYLKDNNLLEEEEE